MPHLEAVQVLKCSLKSAQLLRFRFLPLYIGFSRIGWPFPVSVAWLRAWSILHFDRPGIIFCNSNRLKSFAKRDKICLFVCHDCAWLWASIKASIKSDLTSKYFRFFATVPSFSNMGSRRSDSHSASSWPGLTTEGLQRIFKKTRSEKTSSIQDQVWFTQCWNASTSTLWTYAKTNQVGSHVLFTFNQWQNCRICPKRTTNRIFRAKRTIHSYACLRTKEQRTV